ncbi:sulfur carrier protein [Paracoccus alcaliphilus]|uniref:Sulfur carrier protein n=1 Tax=Paracoccus alcaliphilus TaxID=34002 RepID=A0A1H8GAP5_9RHOB|nr:sulfur carrier protein ThiS [Paracoccus alcaliphilus]WCR17911.1 sulfur carrier protein ThiS [Paracoccus alcaliphilus]SEN40824.1 sulfur carrier protein [Paracoccus alcaliphilus]
MQVELNGEVITTRAETLAALIEERGLPAATVATALDGDFVPRDRRGDTSLRDGARIEVLSPMQGG